MTDLDIPSRMSSLPCNAAGSPIPWCASLPEAVNKRRCWICGERLGQYMAFTLDPHTTLTRLSPEPPSHLDCALFVAQDQHSDYPKSATSFSIVYVTKLYDSRRDREGRPIFLVTEPEDPIYWFFQGRQATPNEAVNALMAEWPTRKAAAEAEGRRAMSELVVIFAAIRSRVPIAE